MRSILLHVDADSCMEARFQVALDLARATGGHIGCLQAVSYEVSAPGDFYSSALAAASPVIKENAEQLRAEVEADLANEGVSWDWRFCYGAAEHRLLEEAALSDVVIVGPNDIGNEGRGPSAMVGSLVLRAAVPVLVVPGDTRGFDVTAPVAVGWNGSAEACVALRAAVPLLALSRKVYLISVSEDPDTERFDLPSTEGARYLSRHGIDSELIDVPRGQAKVADTLFSAAQMRDCGLMVMGAYGRSRFSEMLFGGVTRRSLTDPQMPILLAH